MMHCVAAYHRGEKLVPETVALRELVPGTDTTEEAGPGHRYHIVTAFTS